ncbi:MAG: DNA translocase FtsK 4TM domain-containing protein, partial [Chloroflexi bacterium]|nr:DNA translocase FtsK 4TM domain-containing protein [Chloroflexota bacterium]
MKPRRLKRSTLRLSSSRPTARRTARRRTGHGPISPTQRDWIIGLILLAVALITLLGLASKSLGSLTLGWIGLLRHIFGWGLYGVPLALAGVGLWLILRTTSIPIRLPWPRLAGIAALFFVSLALVHHLLRDPLAAREAGRGGGAVGYWLSQTLTRALGWGGAAILLVILEGIALMVTFDLTLNEVITNTVEVVRRAVAWVRQAGARLRLPRRPKPFAFQPPLPPASEEGWLPPKEAQALPTPTPRPAPELERGQGGVIAAEPRVASGLEAPSRRWVLPNLSEMLIESEEAPLSLGDIREKARLIEETLTSLGVPVTVVEVNPGPVVTQFGLEPGYIEQKDRQGRVKKVKVKVSRIAALANDLALALAAAPIRIEAPVPGKGIVGIEVPNVHSSLVGLRGVMESEQFQALGEAPLTMALGRDVSGTPVVDDLATLPHLLIAGATGTGKSVCINAIIACFLCRNTPDDLRLLMIDPKRVELSGYNGIPHLLAPVVIDAERVVGVLGWLTREMERRYKAFARVGARNIEAYNRLATSRGEARLPYIVVFIDELADLMMVSADEVERQICRIAQLARATGIHLVIATQRPSVDVVTGLIKANFPARLSFLVSSQVDSRVVLDVPGAEKLLGRGDALYMAPDSPKLLRIQGCFVSDEEINRLVSFWKAQAAAIPSEGEASGERGASFQQQVLWPEAKPEPKEEDEDPLLKEAIAIVQQEGKAS